MKYIDVDVFGHSNCAAWLGAKPDPCKTADKEKIEKETGMRCRNGLTSMYKFYLAFENARCHW